MNTFDWLLELVLKFPSKKKKNGEIKVLKNLSLFEIFFWKMMIGIGLITLSCMLLAKLTPFTDVSLKRNFFFRWTPSCGGILNYKIDLPINLTILAWSYCFRILPSWRNFFFCSSGNVTLQVFTATLCVADLLLDLKSGLNFSTFACIMRWKFF